MIIYILKLEQNKWYVGKTRNLHARLTTHFERESSSSAFVKKYKPIDVHEVIENCDDYDEEKYTLKYMKKYGINNVRGGPYSSITLPHETISHIEKSLKGSSDCCFNCGEAGHFATDCPKKGRSSSSSKDIVRSEQISFSVNKPFRLISCFKCGKIGDHEAADCPVNKKIICFNCGKPGHLSTQCFEKILSSSSEDEESNRFCDNKVICYRCGKIGHVSTECYSNKKYSSIRCFKCGKIGHLSTECYVY